MQLYSYKKEYPTNLIPERIRLSDGRSRTDSSTFTESEIENAGYVKVSEPPKYDSETHKLIWNGTEWETIPLSESEIYTRESNRWKNIRDKRDTLIKEVEWRVFRYQSEVRLGLDPTDDIQKIDEYIQKLRDITKTTTNPSEVIWPSLNELETENN